MRIQGDLATYEFSDLLQWLAQGRKSGILVLTRGETEHSLGFDRGRIVMSASSRPEMHLDRYLLDQGLIDEATLARAHRLREATQMLSGQVLVTLGALTEKDLSHALRFKTEEILCDLLTWRRGAYEFRGGKEGNTPIAEISLDVTNVLLECMHRIDQEKARAGDLDSAASVETVALPVVEEQPHERAVADEQTVVLPLVETPASEPAATGAETVALPIVQTPPAEPAGADGLALAAVVDPAASGEAEADDDAPAEGAAAPAASDSPASPRADLPDYFGAAEEPRRGSRRWLPVAAALTLAIAGGSYYLVHREAAAEAAKPTGRPIYFTRAAAPPQLDVRYAATRSETDSTAETAEAPQPAAPTPTPAPRRQEDGASEAELRARYEQQLAELRRELSAARQAAEARPEPAPTEAADTEAADRGQPAATPPEAVAELRAAVPPQPSESVAAPPVTPTPQRTAPQLPAAEPVRPVAEPEPATPAASPAPRPEPAPLVEPGNPVTTPPVLISRPSPRFPPAARRLTRTTTVTLRLLVGTDGRVSEVERIGRKAGLGMDQAAEEAARASRWQPGTVDGEPAPAWVELRFEFTP